MIDSSARLSEAYTVVLCGDTACRAVQSYRKQSSGVDGAARGRAGWRSREGPSLKEGLGAEKRFELPFKAAARAAAAAGLQASELTRRAMPAHTVSAAVRDKEPGNYTRTGDCTAVGAVQRSQLCLNTAETRLRSQIEIQIHLHPRATSPAAVPPHRPPTGAVPARRGGNFRLSSAPPLTSASATRRANEGGESRRAGNRPPNRKAAPRTGGGGARARRANRSRRRRRPVAPARRARRWERGARWPGRGAGLPDRSGDTPRRGSRAPTAAARGAARRPDSQGSGTGRAGGNSSSSRSHGTGGPGDSQVHAGAEQARHGGRAAAERLGGGARLRPGGERGAAPRGLRAGGTAARPPRRGGRRPRGGDGASGPCGARGGPQEEAPAAAGHGGHGRTLPSCRLLPGQRQRGAPPGNLPPRRPPRFFPLLFCAFCFARNGAASEMRTEASCRPPPAGRLRLAPRLVPSAPAAGRMVQKSFFPS